ncbi:MAG: prephenate dehydratase [Lachnospiraceae bacterium]|nr:prephenate dehydratase [Lachnospiraceae bacterium]
MRDLSELRVDIDAIDHQILKLYEERLKLSDEVAVYKIANHKNVYDKKREQEKLDALASLASDDFSRKGVQELFEQIMSGSRKKQYRMLAEAGLMGPINYTCVDEFDFSNKTVVYQGVEGAYSQAATFEYFGDDIDNFPVGTWREAIEALRTGRADAAVLPIENSTAGSVYENYDLLMENDVNIIGEQIITINHCLLGVPGSDISKIRKVYSHPQALMQCEEYLKKAHPEFDVISLENTAMAAKKVRDDKDETAAAIAGRINGKIYDLSILEENIQDRNDNETRFIIVSGEKKYRKDAKKVSLCMELSNEKGALYHALSHFIFNGINLSRIESRPMKDRAWEYRFFIDLEGNLQEEDVLHAIRGLQEETNKLRILGNY